MKPPETNNKIYRLGVYWLNGMLKSGSLMQPAILTIDGQHITVRTTDKTLIDAATNQLQIAFRKGRISRSTYLTIKSGNDVFNFSNLPNVSAPDFTNEQLAQLENQSDVLVNQSRQNVPVVAAAVGFRLIRQLAPMSGPLNGYIWSRNYELGRQSVLQFKQLSDVFTQYGIPHKKTDFRYLSFKGLYFNIFLSIVAYIVLVYLLNLVALIWEDPLFPNTLPVTIGAIALVPITIWLVFKFSPAK